MTIQNLMTVRDVVALQELKDLKVLSDPILSSRVFQTSLEDWVIQFSVFDPEGNLREEHITVFSRPEELQDER